MSFRLKKQNFYSLLFVLAVPIIAQDFIMSSLNLLDVMMVGQLGAASIAALGLSNQIYFLMVMAVCGVSNGAAVFTAQFWGKKDIPGIRKVLGILLLTTLAITIFFMAAVLIYPDKVLSIYTADSAVIQLGGRYLRIIGISYLFTAGTFVYSLILRSVEEVKLPMTASLIAVVLNIFLNYCLIFGKMGFPRMGIEGSALATLISRIIEFSIIIFSTYFRKLAPAASFRDFSAADAELAGKVVKIGLPVLVQTMVWALSVTVYQMIYARISTEALAAVNIAFSLERMGFIFFVGIAHAAGIMIGNRIGAGEEEKAFIYGKRFLFIGVGGAILMGFVFLLMARPILSLYKLGPAGLEYTRNIFYVLAFLLWMKVSNVMLILGIFRSGGDTRTGMILDSVGPWMIGIPLALLSAFFWHFPVYFVVLLTGFEELFKLMIGYPRFFSKKWVNNLVEAT